MKKIGISTGIWENNKNFKDYKMSLVANNYANSVILGGGVPFLLPCINNENIIREQLKNLDAIIITGGEDLSPKFYNEELRLKCGKINPIRDEFDVMLTKIALEMKLPILAICRGAQVLNVVAGGTLYQDLSYKENVFIKHNQETNQSLATHKVIIKNNSFLSDIFKNEIWVNSFHHQAIKDIAPIFKVIGVSQDNVIEAYESNLDNHFMLGIQWHPEMMAPRNNNKMINLFKKFVAKV
ncbi:MAG: putative glutamine amidotransferase [Fusobacteriaceae bacterium]|jgi:putative glutamine amidotransferase|nr:peptidase [Fusobacteriales bacterium]MDN5303363.1 putative glutamine amidotransferase [Fusobacteriaceae bacterium]